MAIDIDDVRSSLNGLIETCKESGEGFKLAAEKVTEPDIRMLFLKYSSQRAQFAGELQAEILALGGEPSTAGSVAGAIHRGWSGLKSAVTVEHDVTVLDEAERGEDSALRNYHEALSKDLPSNLRVIVERQYWEIRKTHDNVRALRNSHWKMEVPMAGLV